MRELLTIEETSKMLGVSRMTLWRWERQGRLVPTREDGLVRYRAEEVAALVGAPQRRSLAGLDLVEAGVLVIAELIHEPFEQLLAAVAANGSLGRVTKDLGNVPDDEPLPDGRDRLRLPFYELGGEIHAGDLTFSARDADLGHHAVSVDLDYVRVRLRTDE